METSFAWVTQGEELGAPLEEKGHLIVGLHWSEPDSTLTFCFGFPPSAPQWKCVEKVTPIIRVIFIVFQILQSIR